MELVENLETDHVFSALQRRKDEFFNKCVESQNQLQVGF